MEALFCSLICACFADDSVVFVLSTIARWDPVPLVSSFASERSINDARMAICFMVTISEIADTSREKATREAAKRQKRALCRKKGLRSERP